MPEVAPGVLAERERQAEDIDGLAVGRIVDIGIRRDRHVEPEAPGTPGIDLLEEAVDIRRDVRRHVARQHEFEIPLGAVVLAVHQERAREFEPDADDFRMLGEDRLVILNRGLEFALAEGDAATQEGALGHVELGAVPGRHLIDGVEDQAGFVIPAAIDQRGGRP